jgi:hypothetical protein
VKPLAKLTKYRYIAVKSRSIFLGELDPYVISEALENIGTEEAHLL